MQRAPMTPPLSYMAARASLCLLPLANISTLHSLTPRTSGEQASFSRSGCFRQCERLRYDGNPQVSKRGACCFGNPSRVLRRTPQTPVERCAAMDGKCGL